MTIDLTSKQQDALSAIKSFIATEGMPPTLQELKPLLKVNSNQAVINYLDKLEERGYITRDKGARGIRVNNPGSYANPFLKALEEGAQKRDAKHSTPPKETTPAQPSSLFIEGSINESTTGSSRKDNGSKYISFSIKL